MMAALARVKVARPCGVMRSMRACQTAAAWPGAAASMAARPCSVSVPSVQRPSGQRCSACRSPPRSGAHALPLAAGRHGDPWLRVGAVSGRLSAADRCWWCSLSSTPGRPRPFSAWPWASAAPASRPGCCCPGRWSAAAASARHARYNHGGLPVGHLRRAAARRPACRAHRSPDGTEARHPAGRRHQPVVHRAAPAIPRAHPPHAQAAGPPKRWRPRRPAAGRGRNPRGTPCRDRRRTTKPGREHAKTTLQASAGLTPGLVT